MKLLVSEYEVHLVNEANNSEFIVKFFGPKDSPYEEVNILNILKLIHFSSIHYEAIQCFTLLLLILGHVESQSDSSRAIPLQIPFYWFREQNLPPQYR